MKIILKTSVVGMQPLRDGYLIEFKFTEAHGHVDDPSLSPNAKDAMSDLTLRLKPVVANRLPFGKKFKITIESCDDDELGSGEAKS